MSDISTKLTYLNTTKGKIKDAINLTGANILSEDTFRSYADKLKQGLVDAINDGGSTIYSNFPKTTGEGTEITLNNTYEAPIEIGLKGNTHQDSYSGINLLDTNNINIPSRFTNLTVISNEIGAITINGSSFTGNLDLKTNLSTPLNGTYSLIFKKLSGSISRNDVNFRFAIGNEENQGAASIPGRLLTSIFNNNSDVVVATGTISDTLDKLNIYFNPNAIFTNFKFVIYLVEGTYTSENIPNYEPYVGGIPSPNPDYPQNIEVVTGDNTINVYGKNLFDKTITKSQGDGRIGDTTLETGKKLTWNGASATTGYMWLGYVIKDVTNYVGKTVRFKTNFSASASNTPQYAIGICDSDGDNRTSKASSSTSGNTISFTIPALSGTQTYLYVLLYANSGGTLNPNDYVDFTNMILTIDNEDMTYQPYQSKDYEISLKSKNLFDKNTMTMTNTFVNPEIGSSNGFTSIYTPCTPNTTYTISKAQETSRFYVGTTETLPTVGMTATVVSSSATGTTKTFTTGANANYIVAMVRSSNDTLTEEQIVAGIQIEENSTATEYEEFYDYKLCKINDYKDKIDKSTGKNLWNEDYTDISTGIKYKALNVGDGTFTMSSNIPQSSGGASLFFLAGNVSSGASTSANGVDITTSRTISSVDGYVTVGYRGGGTFIDPQEYKAQIEQNSQATDYEPYGKVWYIKKNIGKIVLDGTENWSHRAFPDNSYLSIKMTLNVGENGGFCNYFISDNRYDITPEHMTISKQWKELCFAILKSRLATEDEAGFKDWLSTHNPIVYYILKTPTGDKITDNTLISQLEELKKAKSVDDKTFISQINANLPFIISASALSKN